MNEQPAEDVGHFAAQWADSFRNIAPTLGQLRAAVEQARVALGPLAEIGEQARAEREEQPSRQELVPATGDRVWAVNSTHGSIGVVVAWRWMPWGYADGVRRDEAVPPVMLDPIVAWQGASGAAVMSLGQADLFHDFMSARHHGDAITALRIARREKIDAALRERRQDGAGS